MTLDDGMRLNPGDLVQVDPESDEHFGGCVGIVTRRRATGAEIDFVPPGGLRSENHRFPYEAIERVGRLRWSEAEMSQSAAAH